MKAQYYFRVVFTAIIALMLGMSTTFGANDKPRVIIETDIGIGDGDDDASLVRFLLYADVLNVEGMIVTKSGNMYKRYGALEDGYEFMEKFLDAYERVRSNLIAHSLEYPTADDLRRWVTRPWTGEAVDFIIAAEDDRYWRYVMPRLTAYPNVWWSLAKGRVLHGQSPVRLTQQCEKQEA